MSLARSHPGARGPWGKARARRIQASDWRRVGERKKDKAERAIVSTVSVELCLLAGFGGRRAEACGCLARPGCGVARGCRRRQSSCRWCPRRRRSCGRVLVLARARRPGALVGRGDSSNRRVASRESRCTRGAHGPRVSSVTLAARGAWSVSGCAAHGMRSCNFLYLCEILHFFALVRNFAFFCTCAISCTCPFG